MPAPRATSSSSCSEEEEEEERWLEQLAARADEEEAAEAGDEPLAELAARGQAAEAAERRAEARAAQERYLRELEQRASDDACLRELALRADARALLDGEGSSSDDGASSSGSSGWSSGAESPAAPPRAESPREEPVPLHHLGQWHAYHEMESALHELIRQSVEAHRAKQSVADGNPEPLEEEDEAVAQPAEEPAKPGRVINRADRKEARKGILYPRPATSWREPAGKQPWRPRRPWERNARQLDASMECSRDVQELGERLVSAAEDWAAIQAAEQRGRKQLSAVTDVLASVRECLESIHGGRLGVSELKPYFERMLRHVQHLYVASTPDPRRIHGGEFATDLPYRDVANRKYHAKPPVPSRFVDKDWAQREPACRPAPRRPSAGAQRRAARRAAKAEAEAMGGAELQQQLGAAQAAAAPLPGTGLAAEAVAKVLRGSLHPALAEAEAASSAAKPTKPRAKGFKGRMQLREELESARQGVAALEEKQGRVRAELDARRLAAAADAAERDTATLAAALGGLVEDTGVLLDAAQRAGREPATGLREEPADAEVFAGMEGPRPAPKKPAEEAVDALGLGGEDELTVQRRRKEAAELLAAGGYSHEKVVEVNGSRRWIDRRDPAAGAQSHLEYVGAGARLKAARAEQQSGASRTAAWEPAQQQATVPKPRRVGRQRAGFKVTDKHVPTAAKFLFDSNGVTLGPKYLATMQVSVKAAEELAKERRKALGVGI